MPLLLFLMVLPWTLHARIVITEIAHDPLGLESTTPGGASHEYIEFWNLSSDTLNLQDALLTDGTITDSLRSWTSPLYGLSVEMGTLKLAPGRCALICDPDYTEGHTLQPLPIDDGTLLLTVHHGSLLGGLTATKGITLVQGATTLAQWSTNNEGKLLRDDDGGRDGLSSHRQALFLDDDRTSRPAAPSPGRTQGVTPHFAYAVELLNNTPTLHLLSFKEQISLTLMRGSEALQTFSLAPTRLVTYSLPLHPSGVYTLTERVQTSPVLLDLSRFDTSSQILKITEVAPRAETEWLELTNRSEAPLTLSHWSLSIAGESVPLPFVSLPPHGVVTLGKGASMPFTFPTSFDNYQDTIILLKGEKPVDTLHWDYLWFDDWPAGFTIHRQSPNLPADSLTLYLAPPTAGILESTTIESSPSLSVQPRLVHLTKDSCTMTLHAATGYEGELMVYNRKGLVVYRVTLKAEIPFRWDGRGGSGTLLPTGPYIMLCRIIGGNPHAPLRSEVVLWRP